MDLSSILHIDSAQIADFSPDLFITTLWHEARSTTVSRAVENLDCRRIVLVPETIAHSFSYHENLKYFETRGFEKYSSEDEVPCLEKFIVPEKNADFRLLIDCTSMQPTWYHAFFNWFSEMQGEYGHVTLRFAITPGAYDATETPRKLKDIKGFLNFEKKDSTEKKNAILLGLGHEKRVSDSIYKILDPDLLILFYADPAVSKSVVEETFVNNHKLIESTHIRNLKPYPLFNGQVTYQTLVDTVLPLRQDYNLIVIPYGPKIFSLASLLLSLAYPDIYICYPVFKKVSTVDRKPAGDLVVLDLTFECEE